MGRIEMTRFAACAALTLLLAGCDDGAPTDNVAAIRVANPHSDQLKSLSPLNQRIGLMRAIRDSGRRCRRVDALGHQQHYEGMEMWVALCDDGRHWSIFIAPNADVQVRDCAEHAPARPAGLPPGRAAAARPQFPGLQCRGQCAGERAGQRQLTLRHASPLPSCQRRLASMPSQHGPQPSLG